MATITTPRIVVRISPKHKWHFASGNTPKHENGLPKFWNDKATYTSCNIIIWPAERIVESVANVQAKDICLTCLGPLGAYN